MLTNSDSIGTQVETCAQLFLRLTSKPSLEFLDVNLFPTNFPKPGEVIEIHGATATGKTELLMNLICKCILPKSWNGIIIDGIEAEVLFIDTDLKFSVMRLHQILKQKLIKYISNDVTRKTETRPQTNEIGFDDSRSSDACEPSLKSCGENSKRLDEQELEDLVKSSLDRLYLVKCSSTEQLVITLHSVEAICSQHPQMTVLMLDNLSSAFYWEDRVKTADNWTRFDALQDKVVNLLQKLVKEYHLVLFLTKNAMTSQNLKSGKMSHSLNTDFDQSFLSKSWCKISTHKLILTRTDFPFSVSVDGTERYASYYAKVLNKSEHQCKFYISSDGISYAN